MNQRIGSSLTALGTVGVVYAIFFLVPPTQGLGEKVRIAFFHIPVAWVSVMAFVLSAYWALRYLNTRQIEYDWKSAVAAGLGLAFCLLATVSGAVFAKITWGAYWNGDPRQTTIFILLLIYGASLALRTAIEDTEQKAKISAVYSLLAFLTLPFLVFVIPRYYFSLHPSPVLNSAGKIDMDPIMLYVLLAALIIATAIFWQLLGYYVGRIRYQELAKIARTEGG
jgi:heme exporter protein C